MNFVGVTYSNIGVVTFRTRNYSKTAASSKVHLSKIWKPGAQPQAVWQVGEHPFQIPQLVWASFRQPSLSLFLLRGCTCLRVFFVAQLCLRVSALISFSGREGSSEFDQFQGLPEDVLSCLSPWVKSFPVGQNVSVLEETGTQHLGPGTGSVP